MKRLFATLVCALVLPSLAYAIDYTKDPDPDFDRLDGTGASGKKVQVIEWENNLEIHVYPAGSLKGLALKIDDTTAQRVMVIGYRFDNAPKEQLIRRAVLGIPLKAGFKAFKDPSVEDYDKIIISNQGLADQVVAFRLDPEPKQLYPEGHPALAKTASEARKPAAKSKPEAADDEAEDDDGVDPDSGTIKPFFSGPHRNER